MTDGSYIQFGVEGVPYSAVHVELTGDIGADVALAVGAALELQAAYRDAFQGRPQAAQQEAEYYDLPEPSHPNAPSAPRFRPAPAQQPNPMPSMNNYGGAKFYCPIHNEELRPSTKNKTMEWDDVVQMEIPVSWFHTVDGKSCSVWRSKLQIRMPEPAR